MIFTDQTSKFSAEQAEEIRESCPYNIPRRNAESGVMAKCTMCNDRIHNGMVPSCVKVCPTGTMQFGERDEMLKAAEVRLKTLKKDYPGAMMADPEDVNVIYLLIDKPENYHEFTVAEANISPMSKKQFFATLARPFKAMKA